MRVLITGGAGFIGSHLAEAMVARGDHVTCLDDLSTGQAGNLADLMGSPQFRFVRGSITDQDLTAELVRASDVVCHLAAVVGVNLILDRPIHSIETNVLGTAAILSACDRFKVKLVLASTSEIYGKSEHVPFHEQSDRVLGPLSKMRWSYSIAKALDEYLAMAYCQEHGLPVVICRFFNTVGPRQTGRYGMVVPRFVRAALAGEPLTVVGDGQQSRCFCDVRDAVRAVMTLAAADSAVGEVFNIGSTREITILALAERVRAVTNSAAPITFVPAEAVYGRGYEDMRRRIPDTRKIRAAIGWEPHIDLDDTIRAVSADLQGRWSSTLEGPIRITS